MRTLSALLLVALLSGCGTTDPAPTAAPSPTTLPDLTLEQVADRLDCRGPVQGEAGYVGIRCEGSTAQLTISSWGDEARGDIENMNGAMVGDPDLWFMATDSITVSATDEAVVDQARESLRVD